MSATDPVVLVTPGEPAGIGPELVCRLAAEKASDWVAVADPSLLEACAMRLNLPLQIVPVSALDQRPKPTQGQLLCWPVPMAKPATPGQLNADNAAYVLSCLDEASQACLSGQAAALVTGPVHKAIINQAGIAFTGHTEYLRDQAKVSDVVMLLQAPMAPLNNWPLRVALVTTHLPLSAVPKAITQARLTRTLEIVHQDLMDHFGLKHPRLLVLGLNPHAGEAGHLGREEIEVIEPVIQALKARGLSLIGPVPADTAFVPERLLETDAVVAMYHDQGLPVLKHVGFGEAVNITLGLPYIRTSVDHGTALDIAGRGIAEVGSLRAALELAQSLCAQARQSSSA